MIEFEKKKSPEYVKIYYTNPIVTFVFSRPVELGFPEIRELFRLAERFSAYTPYVLLCEVYDEITVTPEGRKYALKSGEAPLLKGLALLMRNKRESKIALPSSTFHYAPFPFQFFTEKKDAINWLLKIPLQE
jgi:hypothetical protein